jgi:hypothetical protein
MIQENLGRQLLVYVDYVNLLRDNTDAVKKIHQLTLLRGLLHKDHQMRNTEMKKQLHTYTMNENQTKMWVVVNIWEPSKKQTFPSRVCSKHHLEWEEVGRPSQKQGQHFHSLWNRSRTQTSWFYLIEENNIVPNSWLSRYAVSFF